MHQGYLNTPSMGLPTPETIRVMTATLQEWGAGTADYGDWEAAMERCRSLFGQVVGVPETSVGLLGSVVPAVAAAAEAVAATGGTMVAHRSEFRSLLLPALACIDEDRFRWVEGPYLAEGFLELIDDSTAAVFISSVASHDGARPALGPIREACDRVGARLVVDGTQSAGIIGLDVPVADLDLFACAGYKGLRGPRGAAYAYARSGAIGRVRTASPYGIADADTAGTYGPPYLPKAGAPGLDQSPAWLSWVGAEPGLESILAATADDQQRVLRLAGQLRDGLSSLGHEPQATDLPSPVVSFAPPEPDRVLERLTAAGASVALRLGRIRMGLHVYNEPSDVELVLGALYTELHCPHQTSPPLRSEA